MDRHSLGSIQIEEKPARSRVWRVGHAIGATGSVVLRAPRLLTPILFMLAVSLSAGTSASFTDDMEFPTQQVVSGTWIPELSIEIENKEEDGEYETVPCITLETDIEETNIYYSFTDVDLLEEGTHYTDDCIELPEEEGDFTLSAVAVHDENNDWKSEEEQYDFTVVTPEKTEEKKAKKEDDEDEEEEDEESSPTITPVEEVIVVPVEEESGEEVIEEDINSENSEEPEGREEEESVLPEEEVQSEVEEGEEVTEEI